MNTKNRRILIIDDNRSIHDDFRKILSPSESASAALEDTEEALFGSETKRERRIPFQLDSACQGQEGVMMVKKALEEKRPYAMAFVDIRMPPGWDGVETTQKIWEVDSDIQIVICTAYSDYSWDEMFEKIGNDDRMVILKKPFDTVEALQLAHALTEKWWLSQQSKRKIEDLEKMVAERTRGLRQANEDLQLEIVEHKRAQAELRESEERFSGAFEHAPIGMALVWPDGRLFKVNRVFCDLVGYSESEMLARTFQEITHPEDLEADLENVRRMLTGEIRFYQMEKRYVHARRHFVTALLNVSLVRDGQGQPLYFIAQIQDITERKRIEAQLFQSQKMETVAKLAGGIAHEFNSIMGAIIGQSELLLTALPSKSPFSKSADEIRHAAGRAATLTRQLLAYGRKQILQPEALNLNDVITNMEGMFRHLMGDEVDVRILPAPNLKPVPADSGQIEQVIVNLAMNAREAMPQGGKLTLETGNITFNEEAALIYPELKPGNYVMLAISDTGTGMSDEVRQRAFEPFFSTKGVGQGTGLGLAACYGIIKQSGGHISVYSEPGRGTTFKVYLPQMNREARDRRPSSDLPRGTERVLLAEDDAALRKIASDLLGRLGYVVLSAANGEEALLLMKQQGNQPLDLLFTDVVLPLMSGKELSDRVLELSPKTKILFTSAYTENAIVHQGVLNPGMALLQKPFTPSALAHKVREVLDAVSGEATTGRLEANPKHNKGRSSLCNPE